MIFACCPGAAALYLLSRRTGSEVEILKSVTRVHHLKDLEGKVFPLIVAVSGSVGCETPIKSEHSGILGAIVKETVEQHFLKRNWKFSWVQDCALMQPVTKEVPWHLSHLQNLKSLCDRTMGPVVSVLQGAIGFALTVGNEVFEKSEPSSLVRGTLDYLQGLKMLGVKRIERVLPIGTRLTIVGEAVKDGMGDFRIQEPERGPFYVSPIPLDQLISKLGKWSRRFKYASMGLTVLGVILISKPVIEYILVRTACILESKWQRLLLKRARDAAAASRARDVAAAATRARDAAAATATRAHDAAAAAATRARDAAAAAATRARDAAAAAATRARDAAAAAATRTRDAAAAAATRARDAAAAATRARDAEAAGLERQHENCSDGRRRDLCVICFEQKCNTAFVQCGHLCCCITCSLKLQQKICPLCRSPIDQVLKIYRSRRQNSAILGLNLPIY